MQLIDRNLQAAKQRELQFQQQKTQQQQQQQVAADQKNLTMARQQQQQQQQFIGMYFQIYTPCLLLCSTYIEMYTVWLCCAVSILVLLCMRNTNGVQFRSKVWKKRWAVNRLHLGVLQLFHFVLCDWSISLKKFDWKHFPQSFTAA